MEQKEYNVILNKGVDYDAFWYEMETVGNGTTPYVPTRAVDIINERPVSLRQCHYALTDDEARQLCNDSRVFVVEIPPENRTDLDLRHCARQYGNFSYFGSDALNWGLFRCQYPDNSNVGSASSGYYNYILDGTGVDVVIMDTGIQANHPDFNDSSGVSRVQQINWFTESGVSGTMPANFYTDLDGHGTHVAGIVAGLLYGWAKNARIYAMHIILDGDPGAGNGIDSNTAMDCMTGWHLNKPVDPVTGFKRPTIVNMSWGSFTTFTNFDGVEYRGNDYGGSVNPALGMVGLENTFGSNQPTFDTNLSEMIDAGINVVKAAGNNNNTLDVPGGPDWDNNIFEETFFDIIEYNRRYYQRGPSPRDSRQITVGAMDTNNTLGASDKVYFSNSGPGIDVWAPGTNIMSTMSTSNNSTSSTFSYPPNPSFKIARLSGTSMAAPQVAGLAACLAQVWPSATTDQLKAKLLELAATNQMQATTQTDYTNQYKIHAGPNRVMYPGAALSTSVNAGIAGSVGITNITMRT
jgi:subtilisin family serine protease